MLRIYRRHLKSCSPYLPFLSPLLLPDLGPVDAQRTDHPPRDDARARHLAEATITKLTTIFEKQFLALGERRRAALPEGAHPGPPHRLRSTWKDQALAASKKYQRAVGFFYFCMRMKWISENPMKSLHPPKVKQDPTLPFTPDEVNAIASSCDRFSLKGIYGDGNRKRLRAMTLLLRYSGLRIRDAVRQVSRVRTAAPARAAALDRHASSRSRRDISDVQDWLGHTDISSTQVYAKITNKRRDAMYEESLRSEAIAANNGS